jgi:hypothetical protein
LRCATQITALVPDVEIRENVDRILDDLRVHSPDETHELRHEALLNLPISICREVREALANQAEAHADWETHFRLIQRLWKKTGDVPASPSPQAFLDWTAGYPGLGDDFCRYVMVAMSCFRTTDATSLITVMRPLFHRDHMRILDQSGDWAYDFCSDDYCRGAWDALNFEFQEFLSTNLYLPIRQHAAAIGTAFSHCIEEMIALLAPTTIDRASVDYSGNVDAECEDGVEEYVPRDDPYVDLTKQIERSHKDPSGVPHALWDAHDQD